MRIGQMGFGQVEDFITANNDFTQRSDSDDPYWYQVLYISI